MTEPKKIAKATDFIQLGVSRDYTPEEMKAISLEVAGAENIAEHERLKAADLLHTIIIEDEEDEMPDEWSMDEIQEDPWSDADEVEALTEELLANALEGDGGAGKATTSF